MYCSTCGEKLSSEGNYCSSCGNKKKKSKLIPFLVILSILSIITFAFTIKYYWDEADNKKTTTLPTPVETKNDNEGSGKKKEVTNAVASKPIEKIKEETKKSVTQIIEESQKKVFTIFAGNSQGSGFLINDKGDVLTNAHVVEGYLEASIKDKSGTEFNGKVIGYSNDTDVAIIRVPKLAGEKPIDIEKTGGAKIGQEVVALGSPLGLENTATLGTITGVDRSFLIGERSYDNIYQMSAHIAPGSSGGPLVSIETGKAVAINSAKLIADESVGFSIPIKDIFLMIEGWITHPLSEQEIDALFYNDSGSYYYEDELDDEWYFEGGDYNDDEDSYYDIPDEWSETEEDGAYEDYEDEIIEEDDSEDSYEDSEEDYDYENEDEDEGYEEDGDYYSEEDDIDEEGEDYEVEEEEEDFDDYEEDENDEYEDSDY
ncbi:trypsin-like peptidase domain-containing protein [Peribacillus sp. NPDC097295]|uniref:trypsin-like peptidase domain-containing protein n=1 Tax=Peribacillus sp. NPDC097295 TaxID=3364402 RepID=UPI00380ACE9C